MPIRPTPRSGNVAVPEAPVVCVVTPVSVPDWPVSPTVTDWPGMTLPAASVTRTCTPGLDVPVSRARPSGT